MKVQVHGLAAVVERKSKGLSGLQRQRANIIDGRDNIGHASGNVIFRVFALFFLDVLLVQYGLAPLVVEADGGIHLAIALFGVLSESARAKIREAREGFKPVMHMVEKGDGTD